MHALCVPPQETRHARPPPFNTSLPCNKQLLGKNRGMKQVASAPKPDHPSSSISTQARSPKQVALKPKPDQIIPLTCPKGGARLTKGRAMRSVACKLKQHHCT